MSTGVYPLFPDLPEAGKQEAQNLIEEFKRELVKAAETALGDLYADIIPYIESDSWTNYRSAMMKGFKNYGNRLVQGEHDFAKIRTEIFREHREELISDLNQDLVKKIAELEGTIDLLKQSLVRRW